MIDMILSRLRTVNFLLSKPVISQLGPRMASSWKEPKFFLGGGQSIEKSEFLEKIAQSTAKVIYIGENHEDETAHSLELDILKALQDADKQTALSLEFYDREAQTVLNEYLRDHVTLETFLSDGKPPGNHADYQPLIDFCKSQGWEVVAANCPRRYTRMVGKFGREYLQQFVDTSAANLLPPLPYEGASEAYKNNFISIMQKIGNTNPNIPTKMLDAQSLWDATMAHSIVQSLSRNQRIVHVTGYFHVQYRLGTVEHVERYMPHSESLTIVILPAEELDSLNSEQINIGDLVVLTDIESL